MFQCIPNGSNINRTISVDIKVPSIFDNSPRHGRFFLLDIIRELGNQFTNLNNAHTAGILEKVVIFKKPGSEESDEIISTGRRRASSTAGRNPLS